MARTKGTSGRRGAIPHSYPYTAAMAEAAGTAFLVFVGCGAIMLDESGAVALGVGGIALAFGAAVAAMVATIGPLSGAHINPAVTVALWMRGRLPARDAALYVPAQVSGALAAAWLLSRFDGGSSLGATRFAADLPVAAGWGLEAVATGMLVFVILVVATGRPGPRWLPPLAIGGTIALAAFAFGAWTGASLNPARSIGPALVAGQAASLVPYLIAPVAGAAAGAWLTCRFLPREHCCVDAGVPIESARDAGAVEVHA